MQIDLDRPDPGLQTALYLPNVPTEGLAYDLGVGNTGRHLRLFSNRFPGQAVGFDSDPDVLETLEKLDWQGKAQVQYGNVLDLEFRPRTVAVVSVGMTVYIPKYLVRNLFTKLWDALLPGGVMHVEFATPRDWAVKSDFVRYGCVPDEPDSFSYIHFCTSPFCQSLLSGYVGGSFWCMEEAIAELSKLGGVRMIAALNYEWSHVATFDDDSRRAIRRSFMDLTVQKIG